MYPAWKILRVDRGYIVAWQDWNGAYGEFTADPMRTWYRMYRAHRERLGWRLNLLRQLHPDDTLTVAPPKQSQRELRTQII